MGWLGGSINEITCWLLVDIWGFWSHLGLEVRGLAMYVAEKEVLTCQHPTSKLGLYSVVMKKPTRFYQSSSKKLTIYTFSRNYVKPLAH